MLDASILQFLLSQNADAFAVDEANTEGLTPLAEAVSAGSLACMQLLLDKNASINSGALSEAENDAQLIHFIASGGSFASLF